MIHAISEIMFFKNCQILSEDTFLNLNYFQDDMNFWQWQFKKQTFIG